ncbi:MAG: sigma-70 family RNA polymerase sigma factor [Gemmatimonadales bacterium]
MPYHDVDARQIRFESVALPFMPALYNTALRLTADAQDAADLLQETYLRAYRTFDNFRPGTNCKAWLFTILHSVVINWRLKARREVGPLPVEELEERFRLFVEVPAGGSEAGSIEVWGMEWTDEVEAALRALPEEFCSAVLLVDAHDLSYEEAATALGCAVGTLGSRLFRGRRLLFAALQDYARRAGYAKGVEP